MKKHLIRFLFLMLSITGMYQTSIGAHHHRSSLGAEHRPDETMAGRRQMNHFAENNTPPVRRLPQPYPLPTGH